MSRVNFLETRLEYISNKLDVCFENNKKLEYNNQILCDASSAVSTRCEKNNNQIKNIDKKIGDIEKELIVISNIFSEMKI